MQKTAKLILILGVLMLTSLVFLLAALLTSPPGSGGSVASARGFGPRLGVMELHGVLGDSRSISLDRVDQAMGHFGRSSAVKAMVLHISSPGGGIVAAEDLYYRIKEWKRRYDKPVVAYLDEVAASGGYYVACAADEIVTSSGCLTGSIGAVFAIQNFEQLFNKIGIHTYWIKGGRFKTAGQEYPLSEEERAMLQATVDDAYGQFLDVVREGRGGKLEAHYAHEPDFRLEAKVRELAEGRIYTGRQAVELGLADRLGGLREAQQRAALLAGQSPETPAEVRKTRGEQFQFLFMKLPDVATWLPRREPYLQYRLLVE